MYLAFSATYVAQQIDISASDEPSSALTCKDAIVEKPNADNSVIEYWTRNAVEQQIRRGAILRQEKPQQYSRACEYDLVNIDTIKSKLDKKRRVRKCKYKIHCRNCNDIYSGYRDCNYYLNFKSHIHSKKIQPKLLKHIGKPKNCPMRIAELAMPNKRRCLETWKEKCNVLPNFIVERLRKQVINETPVVQISEAIYCFKKAKNSSTSWYNKKKRIQDTKNCIRNMEIKTMSIIFGHKIAQQLNKPIVVKLNSHLTKLSKVVASDIAWLMISSVKHCAANIRPSLISEMVNKITLWMAMIIEDSSFKLLEDILEDLEDKEGPVFDFIDELLENVMDICEPILEDSYNSTTKSSSQSGNLVKKISKGEIDNTNSVGNLKQESNEEDTNSNNEEHEEKTSSSIENYITNQLNDNIIPISIAKSEERLITEHQVLHKDFNISKSQSSEMEFSGERNLAHDNDSNIIDREDLYKTPKQNDIKNENIEVLHTQSEQKTCENEYQMQKADSIITNENLPINISENDHFVEERNSKILVQDSDQLIKYVEMKDENLANNEYSQDILKALSTEEKEDLEQNTDYVFPDSSVITLITELKTSGENNETVDDVVKVNENLHDQNVELNIPKDLNLTEIPFEDKISEEIADEKNKKVKFSNTDIATLEILHSKKRSGSDFLGNNVKHEQESIISKPSVDIIKSTISFSAPNEALLSDADELWPKDIPSPIMRPSESVSRSITSLGRIMESDEKVLISPESISEAILEDSIEVLSQSLTKQKLDEAESIEKISNTIEEISTPPDTIMNELTITSDITPTDIYIHVEKVKVETKEIEDKIETPNKKKKNIEKVKDTIKTNIDNEKIVYKKRLHRPSKSPTPKVVIKTKQLQKTTGVDSSKTGKREILQESKSKNRIKTSKHSSISKPAKANTKLFADKLHLEEDTSKENTENISFPFVNLKPDYRVNSNTAPIWINRNDHREHSKRKSKLDYYTIKWCNDLCYGFEYLEIWRDWIKIICESILIHKQNRPSYSHKKSYIKNWVSLKKNIDNEARLWRELNRHTKKKLRHIIYSSEAELEVIPTFCCSKCRC